MYGVCPVPVGACDPWHAVANQLSGRLIELKRRYFTGLPSLIAGL